MTFAALFGKLQEHEIELGRLEKHEVQEKKNKSLALKTKARDYDSDDEESQLESENDVEALVKKFKEFLKRDKLKKVDQGKKFNGESTSRRKVTCFECGNQGHIKNECPSLQKKNGFKSKKFKKPKKAYIAWDDNEISSSSDSESDEYANLALMASHNSDDDEVSNFDSNDKPSYDELQNAFNELYEELLKLSRKYSNQNKLILSLESEANNMKMELDQVKNSACTKCQSLESNIVELNQVITKYEKGHFGLEDVLSRQKYYNNKNGLGFSMFDKPSKNKTIFVKENTTSNNLEQKKVHIVKELL
ncbi:hypothetical protein QL285_022616 [Trifolium repens]|nr:hypothetical protein QL285_022616 [Trifolium repens]